jgi:hypothetical protein
MPKLTQIRATESLILKSLILKRKQQQLLLLAAAGALLSPEKPLIPEARFDFDAVDSATSMSMFRYT